MDYNNLTIEEVRKLPMKNLGYANGWTSTPAEVEAAKDKGFKIYSENIGRCDWAYYCPEGNYCYYVDSSD